MKPIKGPKDFLVPKWEAQAFIEAQKNPNMTEIVLWLEQGIGTLREQLTNIIHHNYAQFVSLSKQLIQLGEFNNKIMTHLKNSQDSLSKSTENLKNATQGISPLKEKQRAIQKEIMSTKIADETMTLLQAASNHIKDENLHSFLDAAIELSMAHATLQQLDQPALFNPISKGIETVFAQFTELLCNAFIRAINEKQTEDLEILSHAVILSGNLPAIYAAFAQHFIIPLEGNIPAPDARERSNSNALLSNYIGFLLNPESPLQFAHKHTPECFDFMAGSFWPVVSAFFKDAIIFPFGQIGAMKSSYDFWRQFQTACEKLCRSEDAIHYLRESKDTKIIEEKLNLDVYVQLVSNQVFSSMNQHFAPNPQNQSNSSQKTSDKTADKISDTSETLAKFFLDHCRLLFSLDSFIPDMATNFCISFRKLIYSFCVRARGIEFDQMAMYLSAIRKIQPQVTKILPDFCQKVGKISEEELNKCAIEIEDKIVDELVKQCSESLKTFMMVISGQKSKVPSSFAKEIFKSYKDWSKSNPEVADSRLFSRVFENVMTAFYGEVKKALEDERTRQATIQLWHDSNSSSSERTPKTDEVSFKEILKINLEEFVKPALQMSVKFEEMAPYKDTLALLQ